MLHGKDAGEAPFPPASHEVVQDAGLIGRIGEGDVVALGIQCRADDPSVQARLARIHDPATAAAVGGERDALRSIGGGCATPFAAWFGESGRVLGMAPEEGGRFAILRDVRAVGPALDALRRGESEDWPSLVWEPWRAGLAPVPLA